MTGKIFRGLKFLEAEFAEAEYGIHHHLRLLFHAVDLAVEIGLHPGDLVGRNLLLGET